MRTCLLTSVAFHLMGFPLEKGMRQPLQHADLSLGRGRTVAFHLLIVQPLCLEPLTLNLPLSSQVDVTDAVLAQQEVQRARLQLEADKVRGLGG